MRLYKGLLGGALLGLLKLVALVASLSGLVITTMLVIMVTIFLPRLRHQKHPNAMLETCPRRVRGKGARRLKPQGKAVHPCRPRLRLSSRQAGGDCVTAHTSSIAFGCFWWSPPPCYPLPLLTTGLEE